MQGQMPEELEPMWTVACLRCRGQKLKCGRELPTCMRCRRQRAECRYPPPPDRKRIAQETGQARAPIPSSTEPPPQYGFSASVNSAKRRRPDEQATEQRMPDAEAEGDAGLPSTEIGLLLLEVYFKRIYNAPLLFHKRIAFQLYMQNGLPGFLLRAIFAHAAVFLESVDSPYSQSNKIFPFQSVFERSWSWARAASREVFSQVDEPSLTKIQTLQVLQFYYFSQNEIQRAIVHATLAYRLSQLLGHDKLYEDAADSSIYRNSQFDREIRRRCFWASWCSFCIGSQQYNTSSLCEEAVGLPLPADFVKTGSGPGLELKLGDKMDIDWKLDLQSSPFQEMAVTSSCSLLAEMVKLLGIWTKVQSFTYEPPADSYSQRANQLQKLVELLEPIESSLQLPIANLSSRAASYDESPELLVSVCSLYYTAQLIMHASMVPILSGRPVEVSASGDLVRKMAEMVLKQAVSFAELMKQAIAKDLDITRLWPLSGYGAFLSGSVFVVYRGVTQSARSPIPSSQVPGPESENMKTVQKVLSILSIYWKPLRKLVIKLDQAIETGHSGDTGLITALSYPWKTRHPVYSSEDQADRGRPLSTAAPNLQAPRPASANLLFEEQATHHAAPHCHSSELEGALTEQEIPSQAGADLAKSLSQGPDLGNQSVALENSLMNSNGSLFDAGWFNTASAIDPWEYPLPLTDMTYKDSTL